MIGLRLTRLWPLAVAAIPLMVFGPDKLKHLHASQALMLIGGLALAFVSSVALGWRYISVGIASERSRRQLPCLPDMLTMSA